MGITVDQIVSVLAAVPFLGRRLINSALDTCSQRHRCDTCGTTAEVIIGDIVKNPLALLSDVGMERHSRQLSPAAVVATTSSPDKNKNDSASSSPTSTTTFRTKQNNENNFGTATAFACPQSPTSPSSFASGAEGKDMTKKAYNNKNAFNCLSCPSGRLGIHTFEGDSTNGDKQKLMERIKNIFLAVPDLIDTSMEQGQVKNFKVEDVFWVD